MNKYILKNHIRKKENLLKHGNSYQEYFQLFYLFLSVSSHVLLESVTHLKQMEKLVDPLELS